MKIHRTMWACLFVAALAGPGCAGRGETVLDVARANGDLQALVQALERTGLDVTFDGEGPFTLLAPTDAAFDRLPAGMLDSLDDAGLERMLKYHVISGDVRSSEIAVLSTLRTVEGSSLSVHADDGVLVDGVAQFATTDLVADNGVLHVLDAVLIPPTVEFPGDMLQVMSTYPSLDAIVSAVDATRLSGVFRSGNDGRGLTVFAPTNKAFTALGIDVDRVPRPELTGLLLYHLLDGTMDASQVVSMDQAKTLEGSDLEVSTVGDEVEINSIRLIYTDLRVSNGIVHILSGVLVPPP